MRKIMYLITVIALIGLVFGVCLCIDIRTAPAYMLAITAGVICYHCAMRLATGYLISVKLRRRINYDHKWFQERGFEDGFYNKLSIEAWKDYVPPYSPVGFDGDTDSYRRKVRITCRAEIVHGVAAVLSLLPLLLAIPYWSFFGFLLLTSLAGVLLDCLFLIAQRYNRFVYIDVLQQRKWGRVSANTAADEPTVEPVKEPLT